MRKCVFKWYSKATTTALAFVDKYNGIGTKLKAYDVLHVYKFTAIHVLK